MGLELATTDDIKQGFAALAAEIAALRAELAAEKKWLTKKEYAEYLGISFKTIKRRLDAGSIETKEIGGERMFRNPNLDASPIHRQIHRNKP